MRYFALTDLTKPTAKFTTDAMELRQISNAYLNQAQAYLQKGLKQLKKDYKNAILYTPKTEYKRFLKWKQTFLQDLNQTQKRFFIVRAQHFSYVLLFNLLDEQVEAVIATFNNFLNEHRLEAQSKQFDLDTAVNELHDYFDQLQKNTAYSEDLPTHLTQKTEQLINARNTQLTNLLNKIATTKPPLNKQQRLLASFRNYHEHLFLKNEVKKVTWLNEPRAKKESVTPDEEHIIELKNVYKYITNGVTTNAVLKGIDLKLKAHDFIVILGPSGSGKTTLLNIISGMDRPSSGSVVVNGQEMICMNDRQLTNFRRNYVGYIFQQYGLLPNLNVRENVEVGANLQRNPDKRINIDELLEAVGMKHLQKKLPNELSGGQQQRVSIARAFAKNPLLIFGDEPTGALDLEMTQIVLKQFLAIKQRYKTTMVIVTHNNLIAQLADLVIYVADGKIQALQANPNPKQVEDINWI